MVPYVSNTAYPQRNLDMPQSSNMLPNSRVNYNYSHNASNETNRFVPLPLPTSTEWHRPDANWNNPMMTNSNEMVNEYLRRGIYRPAGLHSIGLSNEQQRSSNYPANTQGLVTHNRSDVMLNRYNSPFTGVTPTSRYSINPSYPQ
jgi:hypothetical protein